MKKPIKLRRELGDQLIVLDQSGTLGVGGEATVYTVPQDGSLAAKVYRKPTDERSRKLSVMLSHPPIDSSGAQTGFSIAWPVDLLRTGDRKRRVIGFLMPRMDGLSPLIDVYTTHTRLRQRPGFNLRSLLRPAYNLAAAVGTVHAGGYVIGDLSHTNVFVSDDASVTLIDADSFQVRDPQTGEDFRCPVFTPEFTPPELQGDALMLVDRTPEHDRFGLAVLIFQLLMEGGHPFAGRFLGEGELPEITERIAAGHFPYGVGRQVPYRPPTVALSYEILAPGLQRLFIQCFEEGHENPQARPTPQAWQDALLQAEHSLVACRANGQHWYGGHLSACPWCERATQLGGRDPFPSQEAVQSGLHLRTTPVPQTLSPGWTAPWQAQQQRPVIATSLGIPPDSRVWAGLASTLWVGVPAVWAVGAFTVPSILLILSAIAAALYLMTAAIVPMALLSSDWRSAVRLARGSRWMVISSLGVVGGPALIGLIYLFTLA